MRASLRRVLTLTAVTVFLTGLPAGQEPGRLDVFLSFEEEGEFSRLDSSAGVRLARSGLFSTWRANSLEAVFPPDGGEIRVSGIPEDWRGRGAMLLFAWSQQPAQLDVILTDSAGNRHRQKFGLRKGANHLQVDLRKPQNMDFARMKSITLECPTSGTLYLDYFGLDQYHDLLEERGRFDYHLKMDVETPHFKWAKPLHGGPLKVYAINGVIDGRAIIELAQRLAINFTVTSVGIRSGMNFYGFGEFYQQRRGGDSLFHTYIADDLLNGPDFDVILWPALQRWETYPQAIRNEIRRQVEEEGKGLVIFYPFTGTDDGAGLWEISPLTEIGELVNIWPEDEAKVDPSNIDRGAWKVSRDHYITRGANLEAFPRDQLTVLTSQPRGDVLIETSNGTPVLAVRTLGKGRVVAFGYSQRGMIPEVPRVWETGLHYDYWEYMWSLVAKATVWAAGRESDASILKLLRAGDRVQVALGGRIPESRLVGRLKDSYGKVLSEFDLPVRAGSQGEEINLPQALPGGRCFLDLRLSDAGGVLDWSALTLQQEPQVRVKSIALGSDRVRLGETVAAKVQLESFGAAAGQLTVGLYDNFDRLLDQRSDRVTVKGTELRDYTLSSVGAKSHLARVKAVFRSEDGAPQDRAEAEVFVLQERVWDDFDIVMYLFGPNPMPGIWPFIDRQMKRMHVTTLSSYPIDHSKYANYMVQAQTRVSGQESPDNGPDREYYDAMKKQYAASGDKYCLVRKYCLNDPAYRELIRQQLSDLARPWVPFSPLSYYVLEEPSLTCYGDAVDICFGKHCMAAMREWLKTEYGSLESLNRQWGTSFKNWQEVVPDDHKEAQKRGNFSSWSDHRRFMEITYAKSYQMIYEELRKLDPSARLLNSGTQDSASHNGCDYSLLNQYTLHLNAYQYEVHRSMNPQLKISGAAGYGMMGPRVLHDFYQNLFKGANGGLYIFWQYSTIDPDLTLNRSALDMEQGFGELRGQGIGKLVGLAMPDNHGIAVHYSYPSIHGTWIVDGDVKDHVTYRTSPSFDRFNANTEGWQEILRDCGLQFDYLAYSDVEAGQLSDRGYRTFVMPMSVALSDREIDGIVSFVEAGGTVIADALPGVMDQHCAFRTSGKLQRLFGIRTPVATPEKIISAAGDPDLVLAGGAAQASANGKPILVLNRYGKGQAWLLNYFHHSYQTDRREGRSGETLEHLRLVLDRAGVRPKLQMTGANGDSVTGCQRYLFNNGTTRLLGLVPDMGRIPEERIEVRLDGEYAVYDVRQQRYLGTSDRFLTTVEAGVPRLFALLASRITGFELDAPRAAGLGQEVPIAFRAVGGGDLRSVALVKVVDPSGAEQSIYGGNRDIEHSAGTASFRTALNDPAGEWTIEVTEATSGERRLAVVRIE